MTGKFNIQSTWAKFVRDRAHRLRTSEDAAAKPVPSVYLDALKEKAERLGISIEAVKRLKVQPIDHYPTPNCISPAELTEFMNGEELAETTIHHLSQCAPCCALLDIAAPSEDVLKMLLEEVRIRVGAHAVRRESEMAKIFEPVHYSKAAPSW